MGSNSRPNIHSKAVPVSCQLRQQLRLARPRGANQHDELIVHDPNSATASFVVPLMASNRREFAFVGSHLGQVDMQEAD